MCKGEKRGNSSNKEKKTIIRKLFFREKKNKTKNSKLTVITNVTWQTNKQIFQLHLAEALFLAGEPHPGIEDVQVKQGTLLRHRVVPVDALG